MNLDFWFFFNNILLGFGLAMDAFSVSLANGLNEPKMKMPKMCLTSGVFALFQFAMPMIGWICVSLFVSVFTQFEPFIPWIALALLCFIGGKMIFDCIKGNGEECGCKKTGILALLVQGVATSIDALSVGFTIADYNVWESLLGCAIIGILTFGICLGGIFIGKKAGTRLADKAGLLGGIILILIGLEILITSFF